MGRRALQAVFSTGNCFLSQCVHARQGLVHLGHILLALFRHREVPQIESVGARVNVDVETTLWDTLLIGYHCLNLIPNKILP